MGELIQHYWAQLVTGAALIAHFVRTEARGRQNEVAIAKLEERMEKQRVEDNANIQRDFDRLFTRLDAVQADIKTLLQRGQT